EIRSFRKGLVCEFMCACVGLSAHYLESWVTYIAERFSTKVGLLNSRAQLEVGTCDSALSIQEV
ncbi:hypothetical protein J6590_040703, partial [Homalodisca vitripennis]